MLSVEAYCYDEIIDSMRKDDDTREHFKKYELRKLLFLTGIIS